MARRDRQVQHFGAVTKLVQASRDHRCRSIAVTALYGDASPLAARMARDLCQNFSFLSTWFHFEPGRHRWRQFHPKGIEVYQTAPKAVPVRPAMNFPLMALDGEPVPDIDGSPEIELAADAPFSLLRATVEELEMESSMLVLSAPPLLRDSNVAMALSLVPRVILCVPAQCNRDDLITARKALDAMNVELMGMVMTGYRNPLPRWLDYLLGYR